MTFVPQNIIERLNSIPTEDVAERIGLGRVSRHMCHCFMHDDHKPSLHFLGKDRQNWFCFVCNKGGHGPIDLVKEKEGVDFVRACEILGQLYGIYWTEEQRKFSYKPKKIIRTQRVERNKCFSQDICVWLVEHAGLSEQAKHFLFNERKFSEEVVSELNIKSISDSNKLTKVLKFNFPVDELITSGLIKPETGNLCLFTPCLLFPYYDMNGELFGLQSRYIGNVSDAPRFQFISHHKTRLFNLPIINEMQHGDTLYISEGVTDCLALLSSGKNAVAIPSATLIPERDLLYLKNFNLKMYPDNDDNGIKCFYKMQSLFINLGTNIEKLSLPIGIKDFGQYYMENKID